MDMDARKRREPGRPGRPAAGGPRRLLDLVPFTESCAVPLEDAVAACRPVFRNVMGFDNLRIGTEFLPLPLQGSEAGALREEGESSLISLVRRSRMLSRISIAFVPWALWDNWFSHWHPREQVAVASIHAWELTAGEVDVRAFMACEILLNGLGGISAHYSPLALSHEETRGCLFDFCGDKRDIEIKLQNMDLCGPCREHLTMLGIPPDQVAIACGVVREMV